PRPVVSSLNFEPGQTVPNLVTVKVGANGRVNLFNSAGNTHLVADIVGYYTTAPNVTGGRFSALNPARLLDTRDGTGVGAAGPISQASAIDLAVVGRGGVPARGVQAVALNVTVDVPSSSGFLTVWPSGETRPTASTHNFTPGQTIANMVIAKVGANGKISIFNSAGHTHVIADVVGYFSDQGGLFVPVSPTRQLDTRESSPVAAGESRALRVTTSPIPAHASAVVTNVTSVDASVQSYVTVWPQGADRPVASTLNPRPSVPVPNQAYLRVGSNGELRLFNFSGTTNLVVDTFGYFTTN
ncbi:MAG TPA: hypothetical protein PLV68_02475, partial [Ilumatobacteraceae bacterium]|nr:hypothetical protein [Ilumatobacteraceae bacterium]